MSSRSFAATCRHRQLTVLHVHGSFWHFRGLDTLCAQWGLRREQIEFSPHKSFIRGVTGRNWPQARRQVRNVAKLFRLFYSRDQTLILSMSPFDARLMFFALLARRHRMFFHCSWAEWVQGPFPKRVKYQNIRAWWHAFFNKQCQGVFAVSQRNLTTLRQFSGCEVPGTVVNHAVTEAFHARGRAGTGDVFKFIFVGRLVPSKGMDELLAVADGLDPQRFELSVVGYGSQAERMQVACATRANCRFLGRISDQNQLAELYRQHDALLLPSKRTHKWQELFGMVIIEAMACGVVPICTDHVGPCEILAGQSEPIAGDFPAGFLTTEAAFVADAIRISKRLAAGPEERGRLRAAAIAASDQYRDTAIAQRWAALFEAQHAHSRLLK